MPVTKNKLLSTKQVAEICQVSPRTPARWIREGKLKASRPGGKVYRISEADLDTFLGVETYDGKMR